MDGRLGARQTDLVPLCTYPCPFAPGPVPASATVMHLLSSPSRLALSLLLLVPGIANSQGESLSSEGDDQRPFLPSVPSPLVSAVPATRLTSTLVDVLSSDPSYTTLIRLLQRTKLIPTLNKLNGSTLFAPTNEAFERASEVVDSPWDGLIALLENEDQDAWDDKKKSKKPDNILFGLRQNLLYHLLNHTLPITPPSPSLADDTSSSSLFPDSSDHRPETLETMLFPSKYSAHKTPSAAPAPPWLPERYGLLGVEGQRLRGISRVGTDAEGSRNEDWVGVDWKGEGGVKVLGVQESANGIVVKVDGVLDEPENVGTSLTPLLGAVLSLSTDADHCSSPHAAETLLAHPSLTFLSDLLRPTTRTPRYPLPDPSPPSPYPIPPYSPLSPLRTSANQTLFAPSNLAFSRLPRIERSYLESGFAQEDIAWIVRAHASAVTDGQGVGWRETFEAGKGELQVGGGGKVWVEVDPEDGAMRVGLVERSKIVSLDEQERKDKGIKVVQPDIFCENGECRAHADEDATAADLALLSFLLQV